MNDPLYDSTAYELARTLTLRYSSSFGSASLLFAPSIRPHIYAVYGVVRIADEIVDTYQGPQAAELLDRYESDVLDAIKSGYSTDPVIHAFATTARRFAIDADLIEPFFASMRRDLTQTEYTKQSFDDYVYGSAEVIGLMCLKVFVRGDREAYEKLAPGARALGSAYQKVNFLRDLAADHAERGRSYFPGIPYDEFDDATKDAIVAEIRGEFAVAYIAVRSLPLPSRRAVYVSYLYYTHLLGRLAAAPARTLKERRLRVPGLRKLTLLAYGYARAGTLS